MEPTLQVPIKEIEPFLKRGLAEIKKSNINSWNKFIDEEWAKCEGKRWFWVGPLKWESRADVENHHGKPENDNNGVFSTRWHTLRGATHQVIMYRHLLETFTYDPEKVITMLVSDYNIVMSFNETENTITTSNEYYSKDS